MSQSFRSSHLMLTVKCHCFHSAEGENASEKGNSSQVTKVVGGEGGDLNSDHLTPEPVLCLMSYLLVKAKGGSFGTVRCKSNFKLLIYL